MKKVIEIQNIKRNFQVGDETVHALRGVSFNINEGEFVTIMGTSGSGKSTLLNILGCLDTPTSGEYLLDDIPVRTMSKPQRAQDGPVGIEDDGGVEYDLALARRAVELLVVLQGGLAGGKEEIPALVIRRYHVQGTCLGIVQGEPVVPIQDVLYRLVLQQADLLSPPHSPAERLAPAGGRRPAADRPPPPR